MLFSAFLPLKYPMDTGREWIIFQTGQGDPSVPQGPKSQLEQDGKKLLVLLEPFGALRQNRVE